MKSFRMREHGMLEKVQLVFEGGVRNETKQESLEKADVYITVFIIL